MINDEKLKGFLAETMAALVLGFIAFYVVGFDETRIEFWIERHKKESQPQGVLD